MQLGSATASAAPIDQPAFAAAPFHLPQELLPQGVPAPAPMPDVTAAQQWVNDQIRALNPGGSVAPLKARAVQPVNGTLTSSYGPRWGTQHGGIDIGASIGTPVLSAADGTIISAGPASGFGLWVRVKHTDGSMSVYGHINEHLVNVGQPVAAGQQIATVGNRGQSTGPHLHFEVYDPAGNQVDPNVWLRDNGVGVTWGSAA
ncbi:M23 family metallopeptidase [Rhodococcus daqingensis]|uniref:M23 family metallopeptidase n=1 Tax=Rhodococcus daqingensis TaxID=2479363 RepID=A0ABW2RY65_9NOCA